jgi:hypothetical protein
LISVHVSGGLVLIFSLILSTWLLVVIMKVGMSVLIPAIW